MKNLDKISAEFEIAFRYIESSKISIEDKLEHIDTIANYIFEPSEDDYVDGKIQESKPVFMFIDNMIDNHKNCRAIVISELEKLEDYELLNIVIKPLSKEVELILTNLKLF